jgi:hypothetical protein
MSWAHFALMPVVLEYERKSQHLEKVMAQAQLATRIHSLVKKAVERTCEARGMKIGRFVEEALIDKLEELGDIEDIKKIRREPTRALADVIRDLELDGAI